MENQVADTILELPKEVKIDGESYKMPPPSIATLILFSKYVGQMPEEVLDENFPFASLVQQSENLKLIGYSLAAIILGAKEFHKEAVEPSKKGFFSRKTEILPVRTKGEVLAEKINNANAEEVFVIFAQLVNFMKLEAFFYLTTSLINLNLTKRTKTEEVEKTTAFGQ